MFMYNNATNAFLRVYIYIKNVVLAFNSKFLICALALVYIFHREHENNISHLYFYLMNSQVDALSNCLVKKTRKMRQHR